MIEATTDQLARAQRHLADIPGAAERAMSRALNRAASAGRAEGIRAITDRYAARTGDVREMITLSSASPDDLEVTITARSRALSLGYFPHSPRAAGTGGPGRPALTAEIKRGERKDVGGAFVARLNSGMRIMQRTGEKTSAGKDAMRGLYALPLAEMLGVRGVREAVEEKAIATLDQRLTHEIDRELEATR